MEYTAIHCEQYNVMLALEDYGLELLISRISADHKTPTRSDKQMGRAVMDKYYKKLKQTIIINNIICKIGKILHEVDKLVILHNKALKDNNALKTYG